MSAQPEASAVTQPARTPSLIRNTFYLTVAQAATIPLAMANHAIAGRYLGAEDFGYMYLAGTLCGFAMLGIDWGQQDAIPALVARDRGRAGAFLGTSFATRVAFSLLAALVLAGICEAMGYSKGVLWAVAFTLPVSILNSFAAATKSTIRGFERADIPALAHVGQQLVTTAVLIPVLLLGGGLLALLTSQGAVAAVTVVVLLLTLKPVGVGRLHFDRPSVRPLLATGTPFVFFGLALALQPNIDAMYLSKLAPPEVIGWYGVSQRLIGLLMFPATALIGALYPTLCRLFAEDKQEFAKVARSALYGVTLLAVPAACGCALFPELGVSIFGRANYVRAEDNLRIQAIFLFLLYFSMPIGTCILAANKQRPWALVQCTSVVVSLLLGPFLISWFQRQTGNGGMGTSAGLAISEAVVVGCGVAMAPKGVIDKGVLKVVGLALISGVVMTVLALLTKPISLFLAVPLSLVGYGVTAWLTGALQPSTITMVKSFVGRKLARNR
jgi:O-antigen/teichoic acid export membrane protein